MEGFWFDLSVKDVVQCILCGKKIHFRVRRLKQHLAGGFADILVCSKTTAAITKEMKDYMQKYAENNAKKQHLHLLDEEDYKEQIQPSENKSTITPNTLPSSGTTSKKKATFQYVVPKSAKTIASMIQKTLEEVKL